MSESTFWNGIPADCRKVVVIVGKAAKPTFWFADIEGAHRSAVEIKQDGYVFYIDNENGSGWAKVTIGKGSPHYGHKSLMSCRLVEQPDKDLT